MDEARLQSLRDSIARQKELKISSYDIQLNLLDDGYTKEEIMIMKDEISPMRQKGVAKESSHYVLISLLMSFCFILRGFLFLIQDGKEWLGVLLIAIGFIGGIVKLIIK